LFKEENRGKPNIWRDT